MEESRPGFGSTTVSPVGTKLHFSITPGRLECHPIADGGHDGENAYFHPSLGFHVPGKGIGIMLPPSLATASIRFFSGLDVVDTLGTIRRCIGCIKRCIITNESVLRNEYRPG